MIRIFTSPSQALGERGEEEAVRMLKKDGFTIIERNVANRYGEIDIVAKKKGITYFFEVKAGRLGSLYNPAENLTPVKLRKFFISVEHYVLYHKIKEYRAQGILVRLGGEEKTEIEYIDLS